MNALRGLALVALVLAASAEAGAAGPTIFEQKIIALNPCAGLKGDVGGISVGVDRLDAVRIDEVTLTLHGDVIDAMVRGAMSCKTSDAALLQGSVGADIAISATLAVPDCSIAKLDVGLSNIGGEFAPVLQVLQTEAEDAIRGSVQGALVNACHGLVKSLSP